MTSPRARKRFLDALATGLSVSAAASAAGIGRQTAYDLRNRDPDFAAAWDDALEAGTDVLEDEARRRALNGSDLLTIFLLKGRRPWKFRDNARVEVSGSGGGPVRSTVAVSPVDARAVLAVLADAGLVAPQLPAGPRALPAGD